MVLVEKKSEPKAAISFTAEISLFENKIQPCVVSENYEPVIRSQTTSQPCTIDFSKIEKTEEFRNDGEFHPEKTKSGTYAPKQKKDKQQPDGVEEFKEPLGSVPLLKQKSKSQDTKFVGKSFEKAESPNIKKPKAIR